MINPSFRRARLALESSLVGYVVGLLLIEISYTLHFKVSGGGLLFAAVAAFSAIGSVLGLALVLLPMSFINNHNLPRTGVCILGAMVGFGLTYLLGMPLGGQSGMRLVYEIDGAVNATAATFWLKWRQAKDNKGNNILD